MGAIWHWILHFTGTLPLVPNATYNFWSGFGSDIGEVAIISALITIVRHQNCGVKGCYRFGRHEYEMNGVKHKLCRTHHPGIDEKHRMTSEEVTAHYAANR